MRAVAIMNNKGGVGKTVTAINLADILVCDYHKRVVLVDCDGQMNLTRFFLPEIDPLMNYTMADLLTARGEQVWSDNLMPLEPGLDLIPGSPELYELDLRAMKDGVSSPFAAKSFCEAARFDGETDFFIFDCPPGFTAASVAALMAADEVVIPMVLDGFSFAGMEDLAAQVRNLQAASMTVRIGGVLITQWYNDAVVHQAEDMLRRCGVPVYQTRIRRTPKIQESTFSRMPIVRYSPTSAASRDYREWVREFLGGEEAGSYAV